jgi:DNA gyrase subunit A
MVGCVTVNQDDQLLLVTQEGYAKRIIVNQLRSANRGDLGTQSVKFTNKTDHLASMLLVTSVKEVVFITNKERIIRLQIDEVPLLDRDALCKSILHVNRDEKIITVFSISSRNIS